jgi:hypothetical protein
MFKCEPLLKFTGNEYLFSMLYLDFLWLQVYLKLFQDFALEMRLFGMLKELKNLKLN